MAASSASTMPLDNESMEITLEDVGSIEMEVDLPSEQNMLMELHVCRSNMKITMPTGRDQEFLGLPVESSRVNYSDFLYIVLDTNVLLSHLKFLKELKDQSIRGIGRPVLIVPWVVIQELDALKNGMRKVADSARNAGRFINDCLSARHPRVRGQTVEEVNTEIQNLAIENNDDRILHCCLVYQYKIKAKGEQGIVILFSNDTMLCAKAKMNNLVSCDRKNLLFELKSLSETSCNGGSSAVSYTHTAEYEGKLGNKLAEEETTQLIDDCLCQAENYARDAFSIAVHFEMKSVYGDLCNDVMVRKPPWNLEDVITMLDKHWVAVFRYVFTVQSAAVNQDRVKRLLTHVKNRANANICPSHVLLFINNSLTLLEQLRNRPEVWSKINIFIASLKVLKEKIDKPNSLVSPSLPMVSTAPTAAAPSIMSTYAYPNNPDNNVPTPSVSILNNAHQLHHQMFLPHLSQSLYQVIAQCPPLPLNQFQWMFRVIRESLVCGIMSVQAVSTNTSLTRQTEMWLIDVLRYLEGLLLSLENLLNQGIHIPLLRSLYDSMILYLTNVVNTSCSLTFSQLCDICQLEGTISLFQDGLGFMLDGRLQLLELLHRIVQNQVH